MPTDVFIVRKIFKTLTEKIIEIVKNLKDEKNNKNNSNDGILTGDVFINYLYL
jgi:hypothetical protein